MRPIRAAAGKVRPIETMDERSTVLTVVDILKPILYVDDSTSSEI